MTAHMSSADIKLWTTIPPFPKQTIEKIIRSALPKRVRMSDEFKEVVNRCAQIYLISVAATAQNHYKTSHLNEEHIIEIIGLMGFSEFVQPLEALRTEFTEKKSKQRKSLITEPKDETKFQNCGQQSSDPKTDAQTESTTDLMEVQELIQPLENSNKELKPKKSKPRKPKKTDPKSDAKTETITDLMEVQELVQPLEESNKELTKKKSKPRKSKKTDLKDETKVQNCGQHTPDLERVTKTANTIDLTPFQDLVQPLDESNKELTSEKSKPRKSMKTDYKSDTKTESTIELIPIQELDQPLDLRTELVKRRSEAQNSPKTDLKDKTNTQN